MNYMYGIILASFIYALVNGMEVGEDVSTEEQYKFEQNIKEIEPQDSYISNEPESLIAINSKFIAKTLVDKIKNGADYESFLDSYKLNEDVEGHILNCLPLYASAQLWEFSPYVVEFIDCENFIPEPMGNLLLLNDELLLELNNDTKNKIWDLKTKTCLKFLDLPLINNFRSLIPNNSNLLASVCSGNSLVIYKWETEGLVIIKEDEPILYSSFVCNDDYICIGLASGKIALKERRTGKEIYSMLVDRSYIKLSCINNIMMVLYRDRVENYEIRVNDDIPKFVKIKESKHHYLSSSSTLGSNHAYIINLRDFGYVFDILVLDTINLSQISSITEATVSYEHMICSQDGNLLLMGDYSSGTPTLKADGIGIYDGRLGKLIKKIDFNKELLKLNLDLSKVFLKNFEYLNIIDRLLLMVEHIF